MFVNFTRTETGGCSDRPLLSWIVFSACQRSHPVASAHSSFGRRKSDHSKSLPRYSASYYSLSFYQRRRKEEPSNASTNASKRAQSCFGTFFTPIATTDASAQYEPWSRRSQFGTCWNCKATTTGRTSGSRQKNPLTGNSVGGCVHVKCHLFKIYCITARFLALDN